MYYPPEINTVIALIDGVFEHIFPEYPPVGVLVCLVALLLFLWYIVRAGLKHALKISGSVLLVMIFILYLIHSLDRIFFA